MLKNNYAWTFDVPCCPSRRSETCICPDPFCCGTRTHTYPLFALRETIPEAPGETSVADLTGGNRNMVAQEAIIGHYNKNYDVPYCTFFECWGCMKYYETIEYMGQKLANIRFYNREGCCCPDYPIEDGTDNVIGWFAPKERYICCGSYISLMDLNHQELYGVQAKSCQMTPCQQNYEIVTPQNDTISDITARSCVWLSCCLHRYQIDVNLPPKISDRDKVLLLVSSRFCHG